MAFEDAAVLQPDELVAETEQQGASIQALLNQQYATMELLNGTTLLTLDTNSQFFGAVLGSFTNLGNLSGAQLGEQQLYDAAALEGASAMYLLVNTLSGNVAEMLPLLKQLGSSGSTAADGANTFFGAVGAMGSLGDAGNNLKNVTDIGSNFGQLGGKLASAAGFFGKVAAFGPLLSSIAPLLIGGVLITAIVGLIASSKKKKEAANQDEQADDAQTDTAKTAETVAQSAVIGASPIGAVGAAAYSAYESSKSKTETESSGTTQTAETAQEVQNPYENKNSANNAYQDQMVSSRNTAEALREAVKSGNTEVTTQLQAVADALAKLADKPADRNVNSEITINTLRTSATLSEFTDMLKEVLEREIQGSA